MLSNQARNTYQAWLNDESIDDRTKQELQALADQPEEIEERFYRSLEFGTGGMRGVMGAGTNRMNRYTIAKAAQGLASYVRTVEGDHQPAVVIAYDSRYHSQDFALETALVLAGNGVKAYLFKELRPTPECSFAIRYLQAKAGVVITASHNPPEYNGFKVYGADGGQLVPDPAKRLIAQIDQVTELAQIQRLKQSEAECKGLLQWLDEEVDQAYIEAVVQASPQEAANRAAEADRQREHGSSNRPDSPDRPQPQPLKVVYSPLHGTGSPHVEAVLKRIGLTQLYTVEEQRRPDPAFSTVASPNPEEKDAFKLAIAAAEERKADIVIGTDPDADRMGAVVRTNEGHYEILSGNQAGALMLYYVLERKKVLGDLPSNGAVIKTIVTSELGAAIAEDFGLTVFNTLTGFKYIGEKMTDFAQSGEFTFVYGYEESYGYLAGDHCRDKDAIVAAMLIAEAAAFYKQKGQTLIDVLQHLYERYGCYQEVLYAKTLKGKAGMQQMQELMASWREQPPRQAAGEEVVRIEDYAAGYNGLPPENVLKYRLQDGSWFCLRPSGTEPKIKIYASVKAKQLQTARQKLEQLISEIKGRL